MSYAQFQSTEVSPLTLTLLKVARMLGLVSMEMSEKDTIKINNLTLINFVIKCVGPCHERTLTLYMMALQVRRSVGL
jgi:UDP-N-acetylglucosamine--dolichyl-phosphate N-acetylglucosaminephosphotransferase